MSSGTKLTLDELRTIDLFEGLDDAQLARWLDLATLRELPAGEIVVEAGQESHGLHLLLEGRLRVLSIVEDRAEPEGMQEAPTWVGAIPSLTHGWHQVRMVTATDVRLATIPREPFVDLVLETRPIFERLMRAMRPVISRSTEREQNRERLAALGTMAAGLAHELNNPAAAARRASADLADALDVYERMVAKLVEAGVDRGDAEAVVHLKDELLARARDCEPLSALESADAEDAMSDLLEELGVADAWRLAPAFAAACADEAWVRRAVEVAGEARDSVLTWIAASLQAHGLTQEIAEATERMSGLVKAVKMYAFMDRGEVQQADVHMGLDTTLKVLGHKHKHSPIEIVRDYDRSLPPVEMRGSELNQVWTNLLDNAIDALIDRGGPGTITITTRQEGDCLVVDVADDGPGISEAVRQRIFDPFFTTKEVGQGTGLGLDTARRIVVDRHSGSLSVDSGPGGTTFHVWLPFRQPR